MGFPGKIQLSHHTGQRYADLEAPFWYVDLAGRKHLAKQGMVTDGLSIPRFLWRLFGAPYASPYLAAGIIHDSYCKDARDIKHEGDITGAKQMRREADVLFREMLLYLGCGRVKAWSMYKGVRIGAMAEGL